MDRVLLNILSSLCSIFWDDSGVCCSPTVGAGQVDLAAEEIIVTLLACLVVRYGGAVPYRVAGITELHLASSGSRFENATTVVK
mmetsp:Transcript_7574/g.14003  ORF Transcript_7574/g.14003 Transcript_7574/m.14003 type:complete len:84 (-) Transcript_7574:10-261(-)